MKWKLMNRSDLPPSALKGTVPRKRCEKREVSQGGGVTKRREKEVRKETLPRGKRTKKGKCHWEQE
jgi:hypothetical protein